MNKAMSKRAVMAYSAVGHAYFHMFTAFYFVIVLSLEVEWRRPYHELIELWTLGAALVGVLAVLAGWLGDRWSPSGMLVVFFIGMGLSSVAAGYAGGPLGLVLALSGIGLFGAIYHPVGIPLVIRNSGVNQGKALALNGAFGSLGAAMAGVVTGFLADWGGSYLAFVLPGAVVTLTGIAMWVGLMRAAPGPEAPPMPAAAATSGGRFAPLLVLLFCLTAAGVIYHAMQTAMPKALSLRLAQGADLTVVGGYVALIYVAAGLFQFIGGALADRYNLKMVYVCQFFAHGLLLLAAAYAGGLGLVMVLCAASALGAGALPAENMLLARYTPSHRYGLVFGLKFVLFFITGPAAILLVSAINQRTGQLLWVFLLLAVVAAMLCAVALALPRKAPAAAQVAGV